jgi:hypothetical protein
MFRHYERTETIVTLKVREYGCAENIAEMIENQVYHQSLHDGNIIQADIVSTTRIRLSERPKTEKWTAESSTGE